LVFPKAFPYAIIYYNYTINVFVATKFGAGLRFQNASFTIRFELDQLNARNFASTRRVKVFELTFGGVDGHLLHATPTSPYHNVTFFALVWPRVTEIDVYAQDYLPVGIHNNYNILLPTGSSRDDAQNVIPFVIFQQKERLDIVRGIGQNATYRGGRMFVYGLTKNSTAWAETSPLTHDPFIFRLIRFTLFELAPGLPTWVAKVVPSRGHIADVMGSGFLLGIPALDVAPLAYGTADPSTMGSFVNLINYGGFPAILARMRAGSPWFVDAHSRPGLLPYPLINGTFYRSMDGFWFRAAGGYMFTVGGPSPNLLTRYAQDMAWWSTFLSNYTGDFFNPANTYRISNQRNHSRPILTAWNGLFQPVVTPSWPPRPNQIGYGIISISVDPNGTRIIQFWGADAQDTYWLSWAYFFGRLGPISFAQPGTYLVQIYYGNAMLPRGPGPPDFAPPGFPSPWAFKIYFTAPYQYYRALN